MLFVFDLHGGERLRDKVREIQIESVREMLCTAVYLCDFTSILASIS